MGFAAIQNQLSDDSNDSAIERLQLKLIAAGTLTGTEIYEAIVSDITAGRLIHEVILLKLFSSQSVLLSALDYQRMALVLRDAMIKLPLTRDEEFINYAKCAALCMRNI